METTKTSLSSQLVAARQSISDPERWIRQWFRPNGSGDICMCAHGAAQAQCNPIVRFELGGGWTGLNAGLRVTDAARVVCRSGAATEATIAASHVGSPSDIWVNRPSWVRNGHVGDEQYGNFDLHFILGMVGLTVGFNDNPTTTHQMVMDKFDQAIALARQLESLGLT